MVFYIFKIPFENSKNAISYTYGETTGDTQILTMLTFNPSVATIYTVGITATDQNGNTSESFSYNSASVTSKSIIFKTSSLLKLA
ncbi:MAG: hypothetical protein R3Y32_08165 [Bacillota bacterium]